MHIFRKQCLWITIPFVNIENNYDVQWASICQLEVLHYHCRFVQPTIRG